MSEAHHAPNLFISHTPADVGLASALVDFLEAAVPEAEGSILCSSLPGYAERDGATRDHAMLVVLFAGEAARAQITDLMRALDRQTPCVVLCLSASDAPGGALARAPRLDMHRGGLRTLMEDTAYAFSVLPRLDESGRSQLGELLLAVEEERERRAGQVRRAVLHVVSDTSSGAKAQAVYGEYELDVDSDTPTGHKPQAPVPALPSVPPPRYSEPVPRPPESGALRCVEAGVALSECLYHDMALSTLDAATLAQLDALYAALGGNEPGSAMGLDAETFQQRLDGLLEALPPERRYLGRWFEAGFQLALCCNLGTCAVDAAAAAELSAARQQAWIGFATEAGELGLPHASLQVVADTVASLLQSGGSVGTLRGDALQVLTSAARAADTERAEARRRRQQAYA